MRRSTWGRLAVIALSVLILMPAVAFVWLRLTGPGDSGLFDAGSQAWSARGIVLTPLGKQPAGLRGGDEVVAVDGRSVSFWSQALTKPSAPHPRWRIGQTVSVTVLRARRRLTVPVRLERMPVATFLASLWPTILLSLAFLVVAAFVFARRPDDRAARVLLVFAASVTAALPPTIGLTLSDVVNGTGFWLGVAWSLTGYTLFWIVITHFALIFPQPHPFVARHRLAIPSLYALPFAALGVAVLAALPRMPLALAWLEAVDGVGPFTDLVYTSLLVLAMVAAYRRTRGDPVMRRQIRWIVWALTVAGSITFVLGALPQLVLGHSLVDWNLLALCGLPVPLAMGAAILRYRLFDIDIVLNRTLVYGSLTAIVVGVYVLVVGGLGALLQGRGSLLLSLLATGLVAVLFQPLRAWLQHVVNHLLYGQRDEPYTVIARLGGRLEAALTPDAILPAVVETVAQALKLPYAAIALQQEAACPIVAAYGQPHGEPMRIPLMYQAAPVGQLILAPRAPGESFGPADRRLLEDLARQVGVAAHAVRLTADLQHSRERLVTAREEERRRLRRDLHDGLGPTLGGFTLTVGAIRNVLRHDPDAADALLAEMGTAIEASVDDIRRLVYNLRPPALDELGLVGALRARVAQYSSPPGTGGLMVEVQAPETLSPLPAAIEVAAYRVVEEALINVVRHAEARHCLVCLSVADELCVEIADDGVGLPAEHPTGVGLLAMRERATELGGTCEVGPRPGGGTLVHACLPLPTE